MPAHLPGRTGQRLSELAYGPERLWSLNSEQDQLAPSESSEPPCIAAKPQTHCPDSDPHWSGGHPR